MCVNDMRRSHIIDAITWLAEDERFGQLWKDGMTDVEWVKVFLDELISRGQDQDTIDGIVSMLIKRGLTISNEK